MGEIKVEPSTIEGHFNCCGCRGNFPNEKKKKNTTHTKGKGICLTCHSTKTGQKSMVNRAMISPEAYVQCDDCNKFLSRYIRGSLKNTGRKIPQSECRYCEGTNISPVTPNSFYRVPPERLYKRSV